VKLKEPQKVSKEEILRKVEKVISSKVGIVKNVIEITRANSEPPIFSTCCRLCNTLSFMDNKCFMRHGAAGLTKEDALIAGVSEALERYCSGFYDDRDLLYSSFKDIKNQAVQPEKFALFSSKQYRDENFPFSPFTDVKKINWVKGFSLISEREIMIPAQMVFLPYRYREDETIISYPTSTGLSCRSSLEEAILYGLYEVIERDGFILFWMLRPDVSKLRIDSLSRLKELFEERYNLPNWKHYICDITSDISIPIFFTLSLGEMDFGTAVCVGASSNLSSLKAVSKSLLESAQATSFLLYKLGEEKKIYKEDFSDVGDFDDHGEFYTRMPEYQFVFDFITDSNNFIVEEDLKELSTESIIGNLKVILNILKAKEMDVIIIDLTTQDVRDEGFYVVKVIVPELIPLHGNHNFPFKGSKRLVEVPKKWGKNLRREELNPFPHPFP